MPLGAELLRAVRRVARVDRISAAGCTAILVAGMGLLGTELFLGIWVSTPRPPLNPEAVVVEPVEGESENFAWERFQQYRETADVPRLVAAEGGRLVDISMGLDGRELAVSAVSSDYFRVLGVPIAEGRHFNETDQRPGAPVVAILSRDFARSIGTGNQIIGETIRLNRTSVTVVGVVGTGFRGTRVGVGEELWVPLSARCVLERWPCGRLFAEASTPQEPALRWLRILARLGPRSGTEQAEAEAEVLLGPCRVLRASAAGYPPRSRAAVSRLMLGVAILGTFVACLCVINLWTVLLARAERRRRELSVRSALGATRGALVLPLLSDALVLGLAAATIVPSFTVLLLNSLADMTLPGGVSTRTLPLAVSWPVLVLTAAGAVLLACALGLAIAFRATTPARVARSISLSSAPATRRRWRHIVGIQSAVSVVLLAGCLLLARSVLRVLTADLGFMSARVAFFTVETAATVGEDQKNAVSGVIRHALQQLPMVEAVTVGRTVFGRSLGVTGFSLLQGGSEFHTAGHLVRHVGPQFLSTIGVPLLEGRDLLESDVEGAPCVAVVTRTLARLLGQRDRAIGARFGLPGGCKETVVVGVVPDFARQHVSGELRAVVFVPIAQYPRTLGALDFVVRTSGDPRGHLRQIKHTVTAAWPGTRVLAFATPQGILEQETSFERSVALGVGLFAFVAILVSGLGIYGLGAQQLAEGRMEAEIRAALGATESQARRAIAGRPVIPGVLGGGVGWLLAICLGGRLSLLFPWVQAHDVLGPTIALVVVASVVASSAWCAAVLSDAVHPANMLRGE